MTSTQTKPPETKRKRYRGEVTQEQLSQFLARPASKIQNLDRNLRKSYGKGFFRQQQFDDIRELKKRLQNNQEDSVEQVIDSDESLYSLHNDKRTLRRRQLQRQKRKLQEVKQQEGTTEQNQSKPSQKRKKSRRPPTRKESKEQEKKRKAAEAQKDNQSSQNSQDSDTSSTDSSNSEETQSSSEGRQSDQESQKEKEESQAAKEAVQIKQQEVTKKNNLDEENPDSQNEMKEESRGQNQVDRKQQRQQGKQGRQPAEKKRSDEDGAEKYLIKDAGEAAEKERPAEGDRQAKSNERIKQQVGKLQNVQMPSSNKSGNKEKERQKSENNSHPNQTPEHRNQRSLRNRRRYGKEQKVKEQKVKEQKAKEQKAKEQRVKEERVKEQRLKEQRVKEQRVKEQRTSNVQNEKAKQTRQVRNNADATIGLAKAKSQMMSEEPQSVVKIQAERQRNLASKDKVIQATKTGSRVQVQAKAVQKQVKGQMQHVSRKYKMNQMFIVEPSKRQHHLQYCSRVIVESFMFRNYYIIAPYLAVSQLSAPFQIPATIPAFQGSEARQGLAENSAKVSVKEEQNVLRKKRIIQDFQDQQQRESQRKKPEKEVVEQTSPKNVARVQESRARTRRNR